nr:hypothetical protein [Candidatus Woesearchaeota archaeon]
MDCKFYKGFSVYKKGDSDLAVVAIHSGPALETVNSRDDNSDTVASLCWKKTGGTLIISNMPRKRVWGIDFNRDIPPLKSALKAYPENQNYEEDLFEYRKKYAWVAKDANDYENRLKIYQKFWEEVGKSNEIVFIHRAYNRIKTFPSIMDVITFDGKGVDRKTMDEVIIDLNKKYEKFFKSVQKDYKESVVFETRRVVLNILRIYKTIELDKISDEFREDIEKDLLKVNQYADNIALKRIKNSLTPQNFIEAVRNAVNNAPTPHVTIEHAFSGKLAHGPYRKLQPFKDKIVIEIEPTYFMNFWHPYIAADMIIDILNGVRSRVN